MFIFDGARSGNRYDAVLVGAGIMSSTLAVLLHELDPEINLLLVERLPAPAKESSAAENNAGTGHAANCELNYTPLDQNGEINTTKALTINSSFEQSLEFWASLVALGKISADKFLHKLPHISFVWGEQDVEFLRKRFLALSSIPAFSEMEWTRDKRQLEEWIPLLMRERDKEIPIAATRIKRGTDIDFGALTSSYLEYLVNKGAVKLKLSTEVTDVVRVAEKKWKLTLRSNNSDEDIYTPFVFLGAGGGALTLLKKSRIPEGRKFGGFPVSGQWLICNNKELIAEHNAKVYGKAQLGAPPMSVPHLDTRWIGGKRSLLYGPFAGFTTKFLKEGSYFDLFESLGVNNIFPMLNVGIKNIDLVKYLFNQIRLNEYDRLDSLQRFFPEASINDWDLSIAGQRVQIIKKTPKGGTLQMGTEVVCSSDGSLAALLGASPGASTAVSIMLEILNRCFTENMESVDWKNRLNLILPSCLAGTDFLSLKKTRERNDSLLNLS